MSVEALMGRSRPCGRLLDRPEGRRLIDVTWDFGGGQMVYRGFFSEYRALSNEPGMLAEDIGDAEHTLAQHPTIEAVYELPICPCHDGANELHRGGAPRSL